MKYGIGLGSNIGNRLQNLQRAAASVRKISIDHSPALSSSAYLTEPVDCEENTSSFYNMTIELEIEISPLDLLSRLREIEGKLGRPTQRQRNTPRTIDLDILYAGDLVINSDELTIPHPRLSQRRFVLQPLAEIRPNLILPGHHQDIITLLAELDSEEPPLEQVAAPLFADSLSPSC
ncbi:MAG: 2-amino-4-hydroxy-6-hydroxymethyldihydropteridine diphosphokinase [Verrucomicrobia bacterium]|nr:2-amino-4-hydroxy-6-hydroxymethyldihydropteridine diphosphokinase [Verrucomicrobiota bacterium]